MGLKVHDFAISVFTSVSNYRVCVSSFRLCLFIASTSVCNVWAQSVSPDSFTAATCFGLWNWWVLTSYSIEKLTAWSKFGGMSQTYMLSHVHVNKTLQKLIDNDVLTRIMLNLRKRPGGESLKCIPIFHKTLLALTDPMSKLFVA